MFFFFHGCKNSYEGRSRHNSWVHYLSLCIPVSLRVIKRPYTVYSLNKKDTAALSVLLANIQALHSSRYFLRVLDTDLLRHQESEDLGFHMGGGGGGTGISPSQNLKK